MTMFTALAIVAGLGAVGALISGIASMTYDSQVAHRSSVEWMGWRVAFQAAAFIIIMLALLASTGGPS